jgi:inner membrane protein
MKSWGRAVGQSTLLPVGLVAGVLGVDAVSARLPFNVLVTGSLDELCHLATAGLVLAAAMSGPTIRRHRTLLLTALTASVAIDVDHIPMFIGLAEMPSGGRPYTHSLTTIAVLLPLGWVLPTWGPLMKGAALGVGLHFLRDIATGPGLPLLWPASTASTGIPYADYVGTLMMFAAFAMARRAIEKRRT